MAPGYAESHEGRALMGARFSRIIVRGSDWRSERRLLGGVLRQPAGFDSGYRRRRDYWRSLEAQPLTVTVLSDAVSHREARWILDASKFDSLDVAVGPESTRSGHSDALGQFDYQLGDGTHGGVTLTSQPGWEWAMWIDSAVDGSIADRAGWSVADPRLRTISAHTALEGDLLVTSDEGLLAARWTLDPVAAIGVCSPREALTMVSTYLRRHDTFAHHVTATSAASVSRGLFYRTAAMGLCPRLLAAYRSVLAPDERSTSARRADHLEAILQRMVRLVEIHHEMQVVALAEGWLGANNDSCADLTANLRESVVLFSGVLDSLAWLAADYEGLGYEDRRRVSWNKLLATRPFDQSPQSAVAQAIVAAAAKAPSPEITDLAIDLRDTYQHRHPLHTAIIDWQDRSGITRLRSSAVLLEDGTISDRTVIRHDPPVTYVLGDGLRFCRPQPFQRRLLVHLAEVVEHVVKAFPVADSGWLRATPDAAKALRTQEMEIEQCGWLLDLTAT